MIFCRKIQQVQKDITDLVDQVFNKHNVQQINFDIPQELTKEVYVQVIRKVLACVRHEAYGKIQAILNNPQNRKDKLTAEEADNILDSIANTT